MTASLMPTLTSSLPTAADRRLLGGLMAVWLLIAFAPATPAQSISDVFPRTLAPGVSSTVRVTGKDLTAGVRAAISEGAVVVDAVSAEEATLTVTLPEDTIGGIGLWLFTAAGPAEPVPLLADSLPAIADNGGNHTHETAQPLTLPCSVDGTADPAVADWFRFSAEAGQRIACEVLTSSLGSGMDPVIVLRDAAGNQLALADDDATGPECRFEHVFAEAGDYLLELRESRHLAGGRYHLRVGDFPVDLACHPLAIQRGTTATFSFAASDAAAPPLPAVERSLAPDDHRPQISVAARGQEGPAVAWTRVLVSDMPEFTEETATDLLRAPVGISGRLINPGATDSYTLAAKAGTRLRVRSQTRSLGRPTLATLRLLAEDGSVIAETTPTESDEWTLEATLPADGQVVLEVRDLLGRGGHAFGYHLEVTEPPGYSVALAGDAKTRQAFAVHAADGAAAIPLAITRTGYDGQLTLSLDTSAAGLELLEATVPAAAKEHRVYLRASEGWDASTHAVLHLRVAASDGSSPPQPVSSLTLVRARQPRVPFPESWLDGAIAAGGVESVDPFFSLATTPPAFARPARSHAATVNLTRLNEGFKEGVTLLGSRLPAGWSLSNTVEGDAYTTTLTRSDAAGEPDQLTLLAYAEFNGRGRLMELPLTLDWIEPLAVSPQASGPFVAGRENRLPIKLARRGPDAQPVTLTLSGLPEGWSVPAEVVISADSTAAEVAIGVPATATSTEGVSLAFSAASQYQAAPFTISGSLHVPSLIPAPERLEIFPPAIELVGQAEQQQVVVTGVDSDGSLRDWTRDVTITTSDPMTAAVQGSRVIAMADGQATITVSLGELTHTIPVSITGSAVRRPVAFESEVLVALSKQGCSSGACHGSPSGKGLFRLSLRGFDAALDQLTLIREDFGRRVNTFDPEESLLLAKPLMQVSHGGGKQLHEQDAAYEVLTRWIAEGAHSDPADTPRCVRIELFPHHKRVLALAGGSQQVAVVAHFADGSSRDVTSLASYESSSTTVATVDANGLVSPEGRGETVILARFLEHIESVPLTFLDPDPAFVWEAPTSHNFIDDLVDTKLQLLQHTPSPVCSDDEFLRRVSLDVVGLLPTVEETEAFLADTSPDKRLVLIDRLLDREEYASHQALKWGDILRMTAKAVGDEGVYKYHRWVEEAFRSNMPYDEFARAILAAEGSTLANPPANFYRAAGTATDCVETVSQVFLGARLQCAKCHNHPFEKWTQDNYYGLAAFFEPVKRRTTQRPGETFIYTAAGGDVIQPRTGEKMLPWLPGEGSLALADGEDGRQRLVDWLVDPANPLFARIEVNRIWSSCFARGIVDPIDDFRDSNPPSNGPLLDALTQVFIESGFDRKALLRTILISRTYQASVRTTESNASDTRYFSHQMPRLLAAEQLLDAIGSVTEVPDTFTGLPADTKATQLPAPDLAKVEFLEVFGQPQRSTVCACERSGDSNLGMAIAMFNGEMIHTKLAAEANRFRRGIAAGRSVEDLIDELYLAAVCRRPDAEEKAAALAHVATRDAAADGLEDVCWALLNTDEFLFQH